MRDQLDMFEPGEAFVTTNGITTWQKPPALRLWRIDAVGEPVEVTKENTK